MADEEKILKDVKKAVEEERPLGRFQTYLKTFQRDSHVKKRILFNDKKRIKPAVHRSLFKTLLHEIHPGQFGMKALAEKAIIPENLSSPKKLCSGYKSW